MDEPWVAPFLRAIAAGSMISEACAAARVSTALVRRRLAANADLKEAYDLALEDAVDVLESTARRRAVDGWDEPVVYQGRYTPIWKRDPEGKIVLDETGNPVQEMNADGTPAVVCVRKFSDALLMMLLKGRRKELSERTEVTGPGGTPLNDLSEGERAARAAALLAAAKARRDAATTPTPINIDDIA